MKTYTTRFILALGLVFALTFGISSIQAQETETKPAKTTPAKTQEKKEHDHKGEHKDEHKGDHDHKAEKKADHKDEAEKKAPAPFTFKVAKENIQFTASGTWQQVPPRSRMLEKELKIVRVGKDSQDGRLTIMGAGGTIEANIVRWQGQFQQPDGSDTAEKTKTEKKVIAGQTVNLVDITGTYMDSAGGPFSGKPKVERAGYRMLAAIIQTESNGNYFVKLYGPKATIDKNEEHFKSMINSVKVAK